MGHLGSYADFTLPYKEEMPDIQLSDKYAWSAETVKGFVIYQNSFNLYFYKSHLPSISKLWLLNVVLF